MRIRRSSELGRKSISSKLMMRRSTTYVPGFDSNINDSQPPDISKKPKYSPSLRVDSNKTGPNLFEKKVFNPTAVAKEDDETSDARKAKKIVDPVTDIVDDTEDILKNKKPADTSGPNAGAKNEEKKDSDKVKVADLL